MSAVNARAATKTAHVAQLTTKQEVSAHTEDLRALMQALYTEYPAELAKSTQVGPREMTEWVFDGKANWRFEGIRRLQGDEALALLFDPAFAGDHIMALVVGLETLLFEAYGSQNEFDIPAERDQPRLVTLQCQLQSLPLRLQADTLSNTVLNQRAAQQHIAATLHTLLVRLQALTHVVAACP
ncbi:hypothetical protein [Methylophilus sp. 5]|uniref:hypothetical protein n=1 Tax=Methylophilus sp. 5 TaxID=1112274 RepID=UPI001E29541B|nr:hypothetical protein [Methylophilus sp. 5]